jgi:hypothetical protein
MHIQLAAVAESDLEKSAGEICNPGSITPCAILFAASPKSKYNLKFTEATITSLGSENQQSTFEPAPPFLLGILWFGSRVGRSTGRIETPPPG